MNKAVHDVQEALKTLRQQADFMKKKKAAGAAAQDPSFGINRANLRQDVLTIVAAIDDAKKLLAELDEW